MCSYSRETTMILQRFSDYRNVKNSLEDALLLGKSLWQLPRQVEEYLNLPKGY